MQKANVSYPRETAEKRLHLPPGRYSLVELARRMSLLNTEETVSVRNIRPIEHSPVYFHGKFLMLEGT